MKLTFCGAAGTTTGSQHLLEINDQKILLDCGLFQGRRHEMYEKNRHFRFNPKDITCVILSHAHIDHSGNLPNLVKQGFTGNVYTTFATRDLCQLMLADSAHVQAADVRYVNVKRAKKGLPPMEPIYTPQEAETCLRQVVTIGYHRPIPIAEGVTLTYYDAGHILGSAQVVLDLREKKTNRKARLLFSGDIGRMNNDLLRNPEYLQDVDYLLMESTYGGEFHQPPQEVHKTLSDIINRALETKGKILIPAFAVERTQQLIYVLHEMIDTAQIPSISIYVDSPLAVNATEVFRLHPECFNDKVYEFFYQKRNPFGFDKLTLVRELAHSKALNELKEPAIIIAASGMCEAGRILHHLANNISNPATTILFVGHCAEHTLGWKIRQGHKQVNIFGEPYEVNARIEEMDHFSGHADHNELLTYFLNTKGRKKKVWLVHGEPERAQALEKDLIAHYPYTEIQIAEDGKTVAF